MPASETEPTRSATDYDDFALDYATERRVQPVQRALRARPRWCALLGDLAGRRVLDVGCGSGTLTESLVEQGAIVTASDPRTRRWSRWPAGGWGASLSSGSST